MARREARGVKPPVEVGLCARGVQRGRPPKTWTNVKRLLMNGTFVDDDGRRGVAFIGQNERGFPMALFGDAGCRCGNSRITSVRNRCPRRLAIDVCTNTYGCANGMGFSEN